MNTNPNGTDEGECKVADLLRERDEVRAWVRDLQSGMWVNCVYCGHRYGPGETTPVSMADALKAHIEACPDHPLSAALAREKRLREAVEVAVRDLRDGFVACQHCDHSEPTADLDVLEALRRALANEETT
jgi:hypothetical protein